MTEVTVGREKIEVVPSFCYLGDCLSSGGGVKSMSSQDSVSQGANSMNSHHPHLPSMSHHLQRKSLHLHAPTSSDLHNLQRNDRAMIRCVYSVNIKEQVSSQDLPIEAMY